MNMLLVLMSILLGLLRMEFALAGCEITPDGDGLVTIPEGTEMISAHAFSGCKELKTLSLPYSLTAIGDYAFSESGLETFDTSLTDPQLQIVGNYAFYKCSSLKKVLLYSFAQVTVGTSAFRDSVVENVTFYNVETAGAYLFADCQHLNNVIFSGNYTELGVYAFSGAVISGDVTLAEVNIFNQAFQNAMIGGNLVIESMGNSTFATSSAGNIGQRAFKDATINGDVTIYKHGNTISAYAFSGANIDGDVSISTFEGMASYCFANAKIQGSLSIIGSYIDMYAFMNVTVKGATVITGSNYGGDVATGSPVIISDYCFHNARMLSLTMTYVAQVSPYAFQYVDITTFFQAGIINGENTTFPLSADAFSGATFGGDFTLVGVSHIGRYCFQRATFQGSIAINTYNEGDDWGLTIDYYAFNGASVAGYTYIYNVVSVGQSVFKDASMTLDVVIHAPTNGSTTYAYYAFNNVQAKSGVRLQGVSYLGGSTFYKANVGTLNVLGTGNLTTGEFDFSKLTATSMLLDGVNFLGNYALLEADIEGTLAINPITCPANGMGILSDSGLSGAKVVGGVYIGNGIGSIGDNFFYNIETPQVTIGEDIKNLGSSAFQKANVTSITIGVPGVTGNILAKDSFFNDISGLANLKIGAFGFSFEGNYEGDVPSWGTTLSKLQPILLDRTIIDLTALDPELRKKFVCAYAVDGSACKCAPGYHDTLPDDPDYFSCSGGPAPAPASNTSAPTARPTAPAPAPASNTSAPTARPTESNGGGGGGSSNSNNSNNQAGVIAGSVVGGLAFLSIIACGLYYYYYIVPAKAESAMKRMQQQQATVVEMEQRQSAAVSVSDARVSATSNPVHTSRPRTDTIPPVPTVTVPEV